MQERDSFQLTYSQSIHNSKPRISKNPEDEEQQQLSPNKRTMLQSLKETIMKPLPTQEIISSLTSVEQDKESMPCPEHNGPQEESERSQNKHSLPSVKSIKKLASNIQDKYESSRLNIQMPRTVSQRAVLTKKIDDATDFLGHGIQVEKYCFGLQKIERVILFFSEDLSFMGLYHIVKQRTLIVSMDVCSGISIGPKTQRFEFYNQNDYKISQDRSFSLLFPQRSFDFLTKTREHRDRIVNEVRFLKDCLQVKNF